MATKFAINEETGVTKLQAIVDKIDELSVLEANCNKAAEDLAGYTQCLSLERPAIGLMRDCAQVIHAVLPTMKEAVEPIQAFVKNMQEVDEAIAGTSANALDVN